MAVFRDSENWTVVSYPPATGSMWFVSDSTGSDSNDGLDPHGFNLSNAIYTHSNRNLSGTNAFTNYTYTSGDRTDVIYLYNAVGGVADDHYVITNKINDSNLTLAASTGLTADATGIQSSTGPFQTISAITSQLSDDEPIGHQLCFKRGDTWIDQRINMGGGKRGRNKQEPLLFTNYGPISTNPLIDDRPKIITDGRNKSTMHGVRFGNSTSRYNYISFIGLHFRPNVLPTGGGDSASGFGGGGGNGRNSDILIEDCIFSGFGTNISTEAVDGTYFHNLTIRRNVAVDALNQDGSHSQGMFVKYINGLVLEENIFDKNGWENGEQGEIFNHNFYISDGNKNVTLTDNISSRSCSLGIKLDVIDTKSYIRNNLISSCPLMGQYGVGEEGGGDGSSTYGNFMYIEDNVCVECFNGPHIQNIAGGCFKNNIAANKKFIFGGNSQNFIKLAESTFGVGYQNFDITNNILYNTQAPSSYSSLNSGSYGFWRNVLVSGNDHVEPDSPKSFMVIATGGYKSPDITFVNNNYYSVNNSDPENRFQVNSVSQTTGWWQTNMEPTATFVNTVYPDPTRTVTRYAVEVLGLTGYEAIADLWKLQRKGNWNPNLHSRKINNWIRQGFDMGHNYTTL